MKKLLISLIFVFSFSHIFAEFNDDRLTKSIQLDIATTTSRGIERYNTLYSGEAALIHRWAEGLVGFQTYQDSFDFTFNIQGWIPLLSWDFETSRIAVGLGGTYHYQRYKKISSEHDLLANTTFRYKTNSGTTISFHAGYAKKISQIDALADYVPYIYDKYFEAGILVDKVWNCGFELYVEHGLHDLYRYPLFACPHYAIGVGYNFSSGIRVATDTSVRIVDGYTTPPYIDSLIVKLSTRFTF